MIVGYFSEQPWQDPKVGDLAGVFTVGVSNATYDPKVGAELYNRYIDEKLYCEEAGFDALVLNEHHSTPFCMQGVTNVEACILARQTRKVGIVMLGNILPIWDDPLWLAETLAMVDMISRGRLVSGWVRGAGTESLAHNANAIYNWEKFQEAHDFILKTWTTPGPFRWEGKHHQYRYVNPWAMPYQKPHPQMWIPGVASLETVKWAAQRRYPYVMLATLLEPTKQYFDHYHQFAAEAGYKSGPQNIGYLFKVHVDDTEEQADQVGRKYLSGVSNPHIVGNQAVVNPTLTNLPGHTSRDALRRRSSFFGRSESGLAPTTQSIVRAPYGEQIKNLSIISGTPKSVIPKIRTVLETLRPGSICFWDGDGSMTHDDATRSIRLHGQEIIPAAKEIGKELGLLSPFEVNDGTGYDQAAWRRSQAEAKAPA